MKYKVAIHPDKDGFAISVPGLPGCWSQGDSEQEALANIEVAIREYLEVVDELLKGSSVREIEIAVSSCPAFQASITSTQSERWKRPASESPGRANTSS